jgi:cytochrome c biogenesis protein CcmG/thiol:disulfide interchange protein DsbE
VLWASVVVAALIAALIAVLASSKPASESAGSTLIGQAAPPIDGKALVGPGDVSLAQFSGKWVLVNFAASWCIPCRQEAPQLKLLEQEKAQAGGATILEVAYDSADIPNLTAYLKSINATWPTVTDGAAVVAYGIAGIPESYLVDPRGTVVAKYLGGITAKELETFINRFPAPS